MKNMRILIVEDAALMRLMIKNMLKNNGYADAIIIEAADGFEVIQKYRAHKPNLTLMNLVMPFKDGLSAIREIKEIDSEAKVIMLSSTDLAMTVADCFVAGAVDYILKPFTDDKFISIVNKHVLENYELDAAKAEAWKAKIENLPKERARITQEEIDDLVYEFEKL